MLFLQITPYKFYEFSIEDALEITFSCINASHLDHETTCILLPHEYMTLVKTTLQCKRVDYYDDFLEDDIFLQIQAGDVFPFEAIQTGLNAMKDRSCVSVVAKSPFLLNELNNSELKFIKGKSGSLLGELLAEAVPEATLEVSGAIVPASFDWSSVMPDISYDKRRVWAFCAGQYSQDFRGNPKYLFLYANEQRNDICTYWLCENIAVIALIRSMGLRAYKLNTVFAEKMINRTGVLVAEFVKSMIPAGLENAVYLNVWHGVGGIKAVERALTTGRLTEELAKKYIQRNSYYRTHELYLAPSSFIEDIAMRELGLGRAQIIHAGYPRCEYETPMPTFSHSKFISPELPDDTRFAAYIPTYRNNPKGEFFSSAIPDMERLIEVCRNEHICLIFKMHPLLENELGFKKAAETYKDSPWLYFWDNRDDFYEVIKKADLCIMDYSSMFTDFIAAGCQHFLRYAFDFESCDLDFPLSYDEATLGHKCNTFEELLEALRNYKSYDLKADRERIGKLYWEYADESSLDRIIENTLSYTIPQNTFSILHSFDIFDTLITRRGLHPKSIFYAVRERMEKEGGFPTYLVKNYPEIRANAESNVREYYNRSLVERNSERTEISFPEIMRRIGSVYELTEEQIEKLEAWEKEAELADVLPINEYIGRVKKLLKDGEAVILISDMYHDADFIRQMLKKADPVLADLPLFLSSESGYQKSSRQLFVEVYRTFGTDYSFSRWIHTGDNQRSDGSLPRSLNIETRMVTPPDFNEYECSLIERLQSYDAYLIAASLARFRTAHAGMYPYFAYAYVSFLWVPYLHWALCSCKKKGDEIVYFISRDGHQFKHIADAIKSTLLLDIETKYIYASRRTWRIPSFFDHIDVGFWGQGYGNLAHVSSFPKLLKALEMDADSFYAMFPTLDYLNDEYVISEQEIVALAQIFKNSKAYEQYLLHRAENQRVATCGYLRQEMDTEKQFSIVEYWGRGYTQENFTRLWQYITGQSKPTVFYYSRSTLPSDADNIRVNYTSNTSSQAFIESIFSCINYKTIEGYEEIDGVWYPITEPLDCDFQLFNSMEEFLPEFAKQYCTLPLTDRENTGRALIDFAIDWHRDHPEWPYFAEILARQVDSVEMFGAKKEYAPALTNESLKMIEHGLRRNQISKNIAISYWRAPESIQERFREMFQIRPGESLTSGLKISPENITKNKAARKKLDELRQENAKRQKKYDEACSRCLVSDTILILTAGASFPEAEYGSLLCALEGQNKFRVRMVALKNQKLPFEVLASAKYIVTLQPLELLSDLRLRPGSNLIVLGSSATSFFLRGQAKGNACRDVNDLDQLRMKNEISVLQVPSAEEAARARRIYSVNYGTNILETGSCVTDCYFNAELRSEARERLIQHFPAAKDKKIVSYMPLFRMRNSRSRWTTMLDMERLYRELGDNYVVAMNLNGKPDDCSNVIQIENFAMDVTKHMSIRELMLASDIIVADYRDTTFEAALLGMPVFLTCADHIQYASRTSIFTPFDEMLYGVPVADTDDLIAQLRHLDLYDTSYRDTFVERYLSACDGHSAKRIVEFILHDSEKTYSSFVFEKAEAIPQLRSRVCRQSPSEVTVAWDLIPKAERYAIYKLNRVAEFELAVDLPATEDLSPVCVLNKSEEYLVAAFAKGKICTSELLHVESVELPHAPLGLTLVKANDCVNIQWQSNPFITAWNIKELTPGNDTPVLVEKLSADTVAWTGKASNLFSEFFVEAEMPGESFILSGGDCKVLQLQETRWTRKSVTLAWNYVPAAEKLELYKVDQITGENCLLSTLKGGSTEYRDVDCVQETATYNVRAIRAGHVIAEGNTTCHRPALPSIPEEVMAIMSDEGCRLTWKANSQVSEWTIAALLKGKKSHMVIAHVEGSMSEWVDKEKRQNLLGYIIEAVKDTGDCKLFSGYCNSVAVIWPLYPRFVSFSLKSYKFVWEKMSGCNSYKLFKKSSDAEERVLLKECSAEEYEYADKDYKDGDLYEVQGFINGKLHAMGTLECHSRNLPERPKGLNVVAQEAGNLLTWTADTMVSMWNIKPLLANGKSGKVIAQVPGNISNWVDEAPAETTAGYLMEAMCEKDGAKLFSGYCSPVTIKQSR